MAGSYTRSERDRFDDGLVNMRLQIDVVHMSKM